MTTFTIPTIETERLILRAPHADDLPRMTAFYASERSHIVGGPLNPAEAWGSLSRRLGHWMLKGYGLWHLSDKATGAFAGWAGIIDVPGWDEPEIGWTVMDEAEGKGLAFEAAIAARNYAARIQGLNGVISYIAHSNDRSRNLAERLGATYEREGEVVGEPCQVWRHPKIDISEPALISERTGQ
ncbi:GNAT family N-acetyltransferase [Ruegeria profundi]|uniref:GNAT family N-acetyltransferase n=1 Tax=Ruegeria profundi TaxID=1685378 RepID=UPI001CD20466|nr:GNAT family N-acetyltransferase [Ruegeria profundi]MCA0930226.1 GNAT family N-acetyltransferase [Ruegeria profundi]